MTAAIELRDVCKRYDTEPPLEVLHRVGLRIDQGELVSIVGPSGSGKSTLLHIMGALQRPSSGSVRIADIETSTLDDASLSALRAHRLGFVFQDYVLIAGASALENVADGLLYCGVPAASVFAAPARRSNRSRSRSDGHIRRRSSPEASASGWQSPARSFATQR